ncbi:uncharacterized protein LOC130808399 [Amaranthus tricolor]|uniref:uncharacterized protein LOC130808399 n=1 Tax=Amaranthus tricolor TaxID=29722 RepID=UPI002590AD58|nr:uncharacterized protein LOC130808399 [Amaranthus tricolor]
MAVEHPKSLREYAMLDGCLGRNQLAGTEMENPNDHLDEFVNKCGTVKYQGISNEQMKLICFPYSLCGEARDWLRSEGPNKYRTWEALSKAFVARFFSPAKTAKLRNDITSFRQNDGEALYEAWERYKGLQRKCLHHGILDWLLIQNFYNGLRDEIQISRDKRNTKKGGKYKVDALLANQNSIHALSRRMDQLSVGNTLKVCEVCGIQGKPPFNPYSNTYNEGWRHHPSFSYKNPNAYLNPPSYHQPLLTYNQQTPGFQKPPSQNSPQKSNLESLMENFIATQSKINDDTSSAIQQIQAHNKIIDNQMAQMAQQLSNLSKPSG